MTSAAAGIVDARAFTCPICGAVAGQRVAEQNGFEVDRCLDCGHRGVWPVPGDDQLAAIYADDAYYEGGHEGGIGLPGYRAMAAARRRMFERHLARIGLPPGTVLDVGCATGDFLKVAREHGWKVAGVDPSSARRDAEAAGIPLVGTSVHDAAVEPGSLDLVTFWDVLEHVPDPVSDLRAAAALLRPGGLLAATVPDGSSLLAKASGRRWFGYKTAGEHLQFFSRRSLRRAVDAAGLTVVVSRPVAWSCSMAFLTNRARLYMGAPGRAAAAVLAPLQNLTIDMPQINQFVLAQRPVVEGRR